MELGAGVDLARHVRELAFHQLCLGIARKGKVQVKPKVLVNARRLNVAPTIALVAVLVPHLPGMDMTRKGRTVVRQQVVRRAMVGKGPPLERRRRLGIL
jgi:hypothetical protein